jgi:hypothetical protein
MDNPKNQVRGTKVYALGDRGVLVPDGMTPEMVLAGAAVLQERLESYVGPCEIGSYGAQALAREVWKAIATAVRVSLRRDQAAQVVLASSLAQQP